MPLFNRFVFYFRTAFWHFLSRFSTRGTLVLLYHSIAAIASDPHHICVPPEVFKSHLLALKRKFTFITPDEFKDSLIQNHPIPNSILLTFDDGYANNLLSALPILEELNIPALFFVTTYPLKSKKHSFWWNHYITAGEIDKVKKRSNPYLKLPPLPNISAPASLTEAQLKKFSSHPLVTIGAHTRNHPSLSALSPKQQQTAISSDLSFLRRVSSQPVRYFSYPFGTLSDVNYHSQRIASRFFAVSFTTLPYLASSIFPRQFQPRFNVSNQTSRQLLSQLRDYFPSHFKP